MPEQKTLHFDLSKETGHQQAVIAWAAQPTVRHRWPELALLYHVENERQCTAAQGAARKRMGVKKGVPDLCLPVQRGGYAGLYLEMKRPGGHVREEQHWWLEHLDMQGYCTAVCYGWEQARDRLIAYMEMDREREH